ncbi:MAG: hydantoinase B/oxoprolinase family protein [Candidatus Promineofilum sp.]|nr:hydantoinase B/oxoprolinase family protein [Promineifilum sp.]
MDAAALTIFGHLFASVAEEMGVTLGRTAYSPNIKERLDYSCAVFLAGEQPEMLAQAAHIPVHLGAMPASVRAAVARCAPFHPDDVVILNDPYLGGNHLPDITLVSPVFIGDDRPTATDHHFLVASRAHHADVGGMSPGSMPLSTELYQEGIIIPPIKLVDGGIRNEAVWQLILRNVRTPWEREGDLAAQLAAHTAGAHRLAEIVNRYSLGETLTHARGLLTYAESLTRAAIRLIPDGRYTFTDYLDDDGQSDAPIPICATLTVEGDELTADFADTAEAVEGNLNAVPAIVDSAVIYCLRCVALTLLDADLPMNQGVFSPVTIHIPVGSLLDPRPPHAVAAGNVETSQRIVDVVFGALAQALPSIIPAAGQGTMNNLTFGGVYPDSWAAPSSHFAYYETIGGGAGAGPDGDGASGVHVHMSNTRNTPVEALEYGFPIRIEEYSLREGSGGRGQHAGGEGLVRSIRFLAPATVTITSDRRRRGPYGLARGEGGAPGSNTLITGDESVPLPGKATLAVRPGDIVRLETPGGGGWGKLG